MKKFLVLFLTPVSVLEEWMKKDESERNAEEEKMKAGWMTWTQTHAASIVDMPSGAGKTKVVSQSGVADTKNNIMMYGTVQAESHDDAAAMFVGHPHLEIPQATIEIMTINQVQ